MKNSFQHTGFIEQDLQQEYTNAVFLDLFVATEQKYAQLKSLANIDMELDDFLNCEADVGTRGFMTDADILWN